MESRKFVSGRPPCALRGWRNGRAHAQRGGARKNLRNRERCERAALSSRPGRIFGRVDEQDREAICRSPALSFPKFSESPVAARNEWARAGRRYVHAEGS